MNNTLTLENTIALINEAIQSELSDCQNWYESWLKTEHEYEGDSPEDLRVAMANLEGEGNFENALYSTGYLDGLEWAKKIIIKHFTK